MIHCFGEKYQTSGISITQEDFSNHSTNNIEVYYLISGRAEILLKKEKYKMKQGDIILLNFDEEKNFIPSLDKDTYFIRISLSNELFYDNTDLFFPVFDCNSMADTISLSYNNIRKSLEGLIDETINAKSENQFKLVAMGFAFLNQLVESFLVGSKNQNMDTRIQKMLVFIQENAKSDLSLTKVAEHFYMNSSYLSRYFRKQQGVGFQEYLTAYRLQLTENDLIFTDKNISTIALDNGFKNVNVFIKHFKIKYGVSPKEFREKNLPNKLEDDLQKDVISKEDAVFLKTLLHSKRNETFADQYFEIDHTQVRTDQKAPIHLINLGSAADLLQSDYRKQIRFLKKELEFSYGRIWNIFVEEMNVDLTRIRDVNFDRIDSILDFLLELEICPFFELSYKIRRIYKSVKISETPFFSKPSYEIVNDDWKNLLTIFIEHVERRYGRKEVSKWHFELTRDENDLNEYVTQYKTTYTVLKNNNEKIKVGGAGFKYRFDQIPLEEELFFFEKKQLKFDFLSFMSFPYERTNESQRYSKRVTDPNFLINMLDAIHSIKQETSYSNVPIYLTEWGNTISSRNKINDTLYKGAHIIKEIIDMIGKVDLVGYWISSDLYSNFVDSKQLLNGGSGILNKNGIPKPFFFAISFLMALSDNVVFSKDNCLITITNRSKIQLLIHNSKSLNYRYFLTPENEVSYQEIDDMFIENENQAVTVKFTNLPQTRWQVKVNDISEKQGNLLEEWKNIGFGSDLGKDEINYLSRIVVPKLSFSIETGKDIVVQRNLKPNQFCLIEISKI